MNWNKFYKDYSGGEIHKEHVEFLLSQIPNRPIETRPEMYEDDKYKIGVRR